MSKTTNFRHSFKIKSGPRIDTYGVGEGPDGKGFSSVKEALTAFINFVNDNDDEDPEDPIFSRFKILIHANKYYGEEMVHPRYFTFAFWVKTQFQLIDIGDGEFKERIVTTAELDPDDY